MFELIAMRFVSNVSRKIRFGCGTLTAEEEEGDEDRD